MNAKPLAPPDVPRCPFAGGQPFQPRSEAAASDPHPWLDAAREHTPVFYDDDIGAYFVTRYQDLVDVLRQPHVFSSQEANAFKPEVSPVLTAAYPDGHPGQHSMLKKDPPEHTRVRKLAQKAFTPKLIKLMEPEIRERADALLDEIVGSGRGDIIARFATILPLHVITDITGAPVEFAEDFAKWPQDYFVFVEGSPDPTPEYEQEMAERANRILPWMTAFVEDKRTNPTPDLTSSLVHAESDDGSPALSTDEVLGVLNSNLVAGIETTAILIPMLLRQLLAHAEQWDAVRADQSLLDNAIDEALRMWPPARASWRVVTEDTEIGGVLVPAGAPLLMSWAAANRDPEVFEDPATFDLHRKNANKHLSFGRYAHMCLGAPLARLETRIAIQAIIDRLPNVRLAAEQNNQWVPHAIMPRPATLELEWDPTEGTQR